MKVYFVDQYNLGGLLATMPPIRTCTMRIAKIQSMPKACTFCLWMSMVALEEGGNFVAPIATPVHSYKTLKLKIMHSIICMKL